jgi:hypothetical protein
MHLHGQIWTYLGHFRSNAEMSAFSIQEIAANIFAILAANSGNENIQWLLESNELLAEITEAGTVSCSNKCFAMRMHMFYLIR